MSSVEASCRAALRALARAMAAATASFLSSLGVDAAGAGVGVEAKDPSSTRDSTDCLASACLAFARAMAAATAGFTAFSLLSSCCFCALTLAIAAAIASSLPLFCISLRRSSAACLKRCSRSALSRSMRAFFSSKRCFARSAASASRLRVRISAFA